MDALNAEDLEVVKEILNNYKASGIENPLLPTDIDADNDGIVDAYALDDDGNVILVSWVNLEDTVFASGDSEEE